MELTMTTSDSNEKILGEKPEGTPHFNPGNMSGKTIGEAQPKSESAPENKLS
jgi:hypothetical protein